MSSHAADTVCFAWGRGKEGQLGLGDAGNRAAPELIEALLGKSMVQVEASVYHTLGLSEDGEVFSWGGGASGKLGHGGEEDHSENLPRCVEALLGIRVKRIAVGDYHSLALTADGRVFAWGWNEYGQLGLSDDLGRSTPTQVRALDGRDVIDIAAGGHHSMAVSKSGALYTWGWGTDGQLGHGNVDNLNTPRIVQHLDGVRIRAMSAGVYHSACITDHGALYVWGWGRDGRLGHGDTSPVPNQTTPRLVEALEDSTVSAVSCGAYHTAAITARGELYTWGWAEDGRLGHGSETNEFVPRRVLGGAIKKDTVVTHAAAGGHHTIALTTDNRVIAFGWGKYGKLGTGNETTSSIPVHVRTLPKDKSIIHLASGYCHTTVLIKGGADGYQAPDPNVYRATSPISDEGEADLVGDKWDNDNIQRTPTPAGQKRRARSSLGRSRLGRGSSDSDEGANVRGARNSPRAGTTSVGRLPTSGDLQGVTDANRLHDVIRQLEVEKEEIEKLADSEIDQLTGELEEMERKLAAAQRAADEARSRADEAGSIAASGTADTNDSLVRLAQMERDDLKRQLAAAENERSELERRLETAAGDRSSLETELDSVKSLLSAKDASVVVLTAELDTLRQKLLNEGEVGAAASRHEAELRDEISELTRARGDAEDLVAKLKQDLSDLQASKVERESETVLRLENSLSKAQEDLLEAHATARSAQVELDRARDEMETMRVRAVTSMEDENSAVVQLGERIVELTEELDGERKRNNDVATTHEREVARMRTAHRELEDEVRRMQDIVQQMSTELVRAKDESLQAELRAAGPVEAKARLEEELHAAQEANAANQKALADIRIQLSKQHSAASAQAAELQRAQDELASEQAARERLEAEVQLARQEITIKTIEAKTEVDRELEDARDEAMRATKLTTKLEEDLADARAEATLIGQTALEARQELERENATLRRELHEVRDRLQDEHEQTARIKAEAQRSLADAEEGIARSAESIQQTLAEANARAADLEQELDSVRGQLDASREAMGDLSKERKAVEEDLNAAVQAKADAERRIADLEAELAERTASQLLQAGIGEAEQDRLRRTEEALADAEQKVKDLEAELERARVAAENKAKQLARTEEERRREADDSAAHLSTLEDDLQRKNDDLTDAMSALEDAGARRDADLAAVRAELGTVRAQLATVEGDLAAKESELDSARDHVAQLKQDAERAARDIAELRDEAANASRTIESERADAANESLTVKDQGAAERNQLAEQRDEAQRQLAQLKPELARTNVQLESQMEETARLEATVADLRETVRDLEASLRSTDQLSEMEEMRTAHAALQLEQRQRQTDLGNMTQKWNMAEERIRDLEASLTHDQGALQARLEERSDELARVHAQVTGLEQTVNVLNQELAKARDASDVARTEAERLSRELTRDRAVLADRTAELMLSTVLTSVSSDARLQAVSEHLEDEKMVASREVHVLERKLAALEIKNQQLRRDISDAQHRAELANTAKDLLRAENVELQDQLIRQHGGEYRSSDDEEDDSTTAADDGGASRTNRRRIDVARQRLDQLAATSELQIKRLQEENEELRQRIGNDRELRHELDMARSQIEAGVDAKNSLLRELDHAREELLDVKERFDRMATNNDTLKRGIAELEDQLEDVDKLRKDDFEQRQREMRQFRDDAAQTRQLTTELTVERNTLKAQVEDLSRLLHEAMSSKDAESEAVTQALHEFAESKKQIDSLTTRLSKAEDARDSAVRALDEVRSSATQDVETLQHDLDSARRSVARLEGDLKELRMANESLTRTLKTNHEQSTELKRTRQDLTNEVNKLLASNESLQAQLRDVKENSVSIGRAKELEQLLTERQSQASILDDEIQNLRIENNKLKKTRAMQNEDVVREIDRERQLAAEKLAQQQALFETERRDMLEQMHGEQAKLDELMEKVALDRRRDATEMAKLQAQLEKATHLANTETTSAHRSHIVERESLKRRIVELEHLVGERDQALTAANDVHETNKRLLSEIEAQRGENEELFKKMREAEKERRLMQQAIQHEKAQMHVHSEAAVQRTAAEAQAAAQEEVLQAEVKKRNEIEQLRAVLHRSQAEAMEQRDHAIEQARLHFEERLGEMEQDRRRAMARMQADNEELKKENYALRTELHDRKMELDGVERSFKDANVQNPYEIVDQHTKLKMETDDLRRRIQQLEQQNSKLKTDRDQAHKQVRDEKRRHAKNVMDLETQLTVATLEHGPNNKRNPGVNDRVDMVRRRLAAADANMGDYEALQRENDHLRLMVARLKEESNGSVPRNKMEEHIHATEADRQKLVDDLYTMRKDLELTRQQRDEAVAYASHESARRAKAMEGMHRGSSGKSSRSAAKVDDLQNDLKFEREAHDQVKKEVAKLKADATAMHHDMKAADRRISLLEREKRELESQAERSNVDNRVALEEIDALRKELDHVHRQAASQGMAIAPLQQSKHKGADSQDRLDLASEDRRKLASHNKALEKQIAELKAHIHLLETSGGRGGSGGSRPQPGGSGPSKLRVEEDIEKQRRKLAEMGGGRSTDAQALFAGDEELKRANASLRDKMARFELMQDNLEKLFALRMEMSESSDDNSRIEAVQRRITRLREQTKYQTGDLFDQVSRLIHENGKLQIQCNRMGGKSAARSEPVRRRFEPVTSKGSNARPEGAQGIPPRAGRGERAQAPGASKVAEEKSWWEAIIPFGSDEDEAVPPERRRR